MRTRIDHLREKLSFDQQRGSVNRSGSCGFDRLLEGIAFEFVVLNGLSSCLLSSKLLLPLCRFHTHVRVVPVVLAEIFELLLQFVDGGRVLRVVILIRRLLRILFQIVEFPFGEWIKVSQLKAVRTDCVL